MRNNPVRTGSKGARRIHLSTKWKIAMKIIEKKKMEKEKRNADDYPDLDDTASAKGL